jgi:hypothetical protein
MNNEVFCASATTVIPLLLIAVMATRTLRAGEFSGHPAVTVLASGLPVISEVAAFAFLFFEPVPAAAALILTPGYLDRVHGVLLTGPFRDHPLWLRPPGGCFPRRHRSVTMGA